MSLSSIQPRKQRSPGKGTRWPPEGNVLPIRLRAAGMEYGEISKQLPGHNKSACRAQRTILTKRKTNKENESVQKSLRSWEEHAVINDGRTKNISWDEIADLLPGRNRRACTNYWYRVLKQNSGTL
jgi:hypothetical protein